MMLTSCLAFSAASALAYSPSGAAIVTQRPALRIASRAAFAPLMAEIEEFPSMEELAAEAGMSVEEYEKQMFGEAMTEEEYEAEQEQELSADAKQIVNNMRSASGVEFAPWMKVDAEAIAKAKKERAERKARQAAESAGKSDNMLIDPQAAELGAGGGLKSKILGEEEIELRWSTQDEIGNAGFIVQRRQGGQSAFGDIASFENFSPLRTKGPEGGDYVYLDDTVSPGTWVYRIVDCDTKGEKSAVCQKLVEVDSNAESMQTVAVGVVIAGIALALVVAGILSDPIQTTDKGAAFF